MEVYQRKKLGKKVDEKQLDDKKLPKKECEEEEEVKIPKLTETVKQRPRTSVDKPINYNGDAADKAKRSRRKRSVAVYFDDEMEKDDDDENENEMTSGEGDDDDDVTRRKFKKDKTKRRRCKRSVAVYFDDEMEKDDDDENENEMTSGEEEDDDDVTRRKCKGKRRRKANSKNISPEARNERCSVFDTRMSPTIFMDFIRSNPSDEQVAAIKSIEFEGLLQMKNDLFPGYLAKWLVTNFDSDTCSLTLPHDQLDITDYDIHLATGIPLGPNDVDYAMRQDTSKRFVRVKKDWLLQFNKEKVYTKEVLEKVIEGRDGGDQFKRNFVMLVVNSFLGGVSGVYASCRILKSLEDVSCISSFNWCAFTNEHLVDGIEL